MGIEEEIRTLEVIIAELGSRADPSRLVYTMRTRAPVFHCEASPSELLAAKQGTCRLAGRRSAAV